MHDSCDCCSVCPSIRRRFVTEAHRRWRQLLPCITSIAHAPPLGLCLAESCRKTVLLTTISFSHGLDRCWCTAPCAFVAALINEFVTQRFGHTCFDTYFNAQYRRALCFMPLSSYIVNHEPTGSVLVTVGERCSSALWRRRRR